MEWVKILNPPDLVKEQGIPVVSISATHSFVLHRDLNRISELTGRTPRSGTYSYGNFSGVKIEDSLPVMILIHLGKEMVDLFGLKNIYFKTDSESISSDLDSSDARNMFVFVNCVPGGGQALLNNNLPKVLKFGDFEATIPEKVLKTFKVAPANCNTHIIKDDNEVTIAYSRDNKVWIPFDIGAMENGGRDLNWLPTSVTRLILQRAIPISMTEDPPKQTEEERISILEEAKEKWIDVWKSDSEQRILNIKQQLEENEKRYKDLCDQLASCVKLREEYSRQLMFEGFAGNRDAPAIIEFEKLLQDIPELSSIYFNDGKITFRTSMIYMEEDVSKDPYEFDPFPLGEFDIICQPGEKPLLKNRTCTLQYDGSTWHHPHAKNGHICFGNISGQLSELSSMRKWHDVVVLAIQFLKNCTAKDDEWGRLGFKKWQKAGDIKKASVTHKNDVIPRIIEWAKYVPVVRTYNLKPDDKVQATCPAACPIFNKKNSDGKPSCPIQGTGKHEGKVTNMLDEFVNVSWKDKVIDSDEELEVDCIGFSYSNILRLDGKPMYEGHNPSSLYPEKDIREDIKNGLIGIIDSITLAEATVYAKQTEAELMEIVAEDKNDKIDLKTIDDITEELNA